MTAIEITYSHYLDTERDTSPRGNALAVADEYVIHSALLTRLNALSPKAWERELNHLTKRLDNQKDITDEDREDILTWTRARYEFLIGVGFDDDETRSEQWAQYLQTWVPSAMDLDGLFI